MKIEAIKIVTLTYAEVPQFTEICLLISHDKGIIFPLLQY